MSNLMMDIYNSFLNDSVISQYITENSIKFYEYPNANEITNSVIVIDEVISPEIKDFADDNPLSYEYIFQIDIFVKQANNNVNGSLVSSELILEIQRIMWEEYGFRVFQSFAPEYDSSFKLYRQSKQFRGRKYINN
ncbi:hypothetical protein [Staphylococcus shinii]|uniref:hypothetical protein n=1 Tax=Staphylococcus shinii TaxID=2912228 RepID=UPI003F852C26